MRVLITTDTLGGVWTFTQELTTNLLHAGHSVALVGFGRVPSISQQVWCTAMQAIYAKSFIPVFSSTPLEWMEGNAAAYSDGAEVLSTTARSFRPDVLHTSQFCFGRLDFPVPKVITAHSEVFGWARACYPEGLPKSSWLNHYTSLVQHGLDAADAVVAPTRWMLDSLASSFKLPKTRIVIGNGRTLRNAHPAEPRIMQAVSLGRFWDPAKGLSSLLQLQVSIPILIAGETLFEGASAPLGSLSITSLGLLSEVEVLRLLRTSSIYLATSLYEPFGLAPLEAALSGCAIVARDIPSLREVWSDTALYFTANNELKTLLEVLSANLPMLQQAQLAAQARANLMSGASMTQKYLDLYTALLEDEAVHCPATLAEAYSHGH